MDIPVGRGKNTKRIKLLQRDFVVIMTEATEGTKIIAGKVVASERWKI
jgi:hypothetical protein